LGPASHFAYDAGLEPIAFVAWRASIGVLGLAIVLRLFATEPTALIGGLLARERLSLVVAGVTFLALNLALFTAYDLSSVGVVLLGFYTYPAFVALASAACLGEPLGRGKGSALGLALAGMVLVVAGPALLGGELAVRPEGLALALFAAAAEAFYLLLNRWGHPSVPPAQASGAMLAIAAIGFVLVGILTGNGAALLLPIAEPGLLPLLGFVGLVGAMIPTTLIIIAVRRIGPSRTAILALAEPVVGVVLATVLLDERLEPVQIAGGAAILASGVLLQLVREPALEARGTGGGCSGNSPRND